MMQSRFSYVTANLVAQPLGFDMPEGWQQGDAASNAYYRPLETFESRFGAMLREVKALGFDAIDLWSAHLHWQWATLEHVAIAKRLLEAEGMSVTSYPAWVGGGASDLRGACRLCQALGVDVIAGHIELLDTDRSTAVSILREHGVGCGIENHTETSIEELRARLGEGDEDVVGIALDTGWCGTRGWDALEGLDTLYDRIFAVHLKDVRAKRSAPTGYQFIDWGHETCALGDGIVPVEAVLKELRVRGFRGPIGIENEPEHYDPKEEVAESLKRAEAWWAEAEPKVAAPLRVVVVGCGNIAQGYGEAMERRPEIEVAGATDIDPERAKAWTARFGGTAYASLADALADASVEAVVNLTIQGAHVEVVSKALEAGKHVHSEKPLAPSFAEARRLVELAKAKGLRLSCAPATWLGESQRQARRLIEGGAIGRPRLAYVNVDWGRIEGWHPNPGPFYEVGPLADVGVYGLTLLTSWFGPVARVVADGTKLLTERRDAQGKAFAVAKEDWMTVSLTFASGFRARMTASFYVGTVGGLQPAYEIHGDEGSLRSEWFAAGAPLEIGKTGEGYRRVRLEEKPLGRGPWHCDWSAGVHGLWKALREGGPHPTTGAQAAHVVEILEAAHRSLAEGSAVALRSRFEQEELMVDEPDA